MDEDPVVWCLGEGLLDKISTQPGVDVDGVTTWDEQFGGAPANVAVALCQRHVKSGLLGCVGNDQRGSSLRAELQRRGVDVRGLVTGPWNTRVATVLLDSNGNRFFDGFEGDADEYHIPRHLPESFPGTAKILHHGTISLRHGIAAAEATR